MGEKAKVLADQENMYPTWKVFKGLILGADQTYHSLQDKRQCANGR